MSFLLLCFLAITACQPTQKKPGIYFWDQAYFPLTPESKLPIGKFSSLYLRYFDVTWNDQFDVPLPKPTFMFDYSDTAFYGAAVLVPVIHIENKVLQKLPIDSMESLARRIVRKTELVSGHIHKKTGKEPGKDLQYDCDWTTDTREKYFKLLEYLVTKESQKTVTATVPLYAYKDRATYGVPPVKAAMLKCYDNGDSTRPVSTNANLEIDKLKSYFADTSVYPLPLSLQFPVAARYALYRDGKLMGVPNLQSNAMTNATLFVPTENTGYVMSVDTSWAGTELKKGDQLKREIVDPAVLSAAIQYVKTKVPKYDIITFNNWSPPVTLRYDSLMIPEKP
ncbi:hypothetical protein [Chitinophaga sp. Cy-1792]|uniref:hypothetical protein n=1 Tax=Chitinophaga sp. Cy-1792 TaxID=2608339 RepID=UPI00141E04C8|nr:hypothetical protein [Chitinophaga sp. Cy-1792]NIG56092.1 hypothetical protein [Chitinophaga sp. Cy-1792]